MRTIRAGVQGVLRAFPGRFVTWIRKFPLPPEKGFLSVHKGRKRYRGMIVSIIILRFLSAEFIADTEDGFYVGRVLAVRFYLFPQVVDHVDNA